MSSNAKKKFAPFLERLRAVAGSARRFAIAGARDADVESSSVHLFATGKRSHAASLSIPTAVGSMVFLVNDLVVVGGTDGSLRVVDAEAAEPALLGSHDGPGGGVLGMATDAAGTSLAVVTESGRVGVYRLVVEGGKPRLDRIGQRGLSPRPLRTVGFDPVRARVVTGGDDGVVHVVALDDLENAPVREMPTGEGGVRALVVTDDGRVVAGCGDGSLRISYLDGAADEEDRSKDAAHERAVVGLVLGPVLRDEAGREIPRRLFSAGADGVVKSWPLETRRKPKTVELGSAALTGLVWLPPSARAKQDKRGGSLVAIDAKRSLVALTLDEQGAIAEETERVHGELAERTEQLGASGTKVRIAAIKALAEHPEDDARLLIERALERDSKPEVRLLAADVLGRSGNRRVRAALRSALADDDKKVRGTAFEGLLLRIDKDDPISTLRAAVSGSHTDLRVRALGALPPLRKQSALVPGLVAERLSDREPKVRHAAFEALVALEPQGSVEPARVALARGPQDVRASGLFWLGRTRASETPEGAALVEAALDDEDSSVRQMAFIVAASARVVLGRTLYRLDGEFRTAVDLAHKQGPLLPAAPKDSMPNEDDRASLFAALNCRHPDTALRGARGLALLQDPRATGALLQLSREADDGLRRAVVDTLHLAGEAMPADDRIRTRLQWLLDDSDPGVRTDAFDALAALALPRGDVGALEVAAVAMQSGQDDMRAKALAIIVGHGPKAAPANHATADALLSAALDDESGKVRATAYKTLWAWHSDTPQPMLERASASRHADTRQQVVAELDRTDGDWATSLLLTMVGDGNESVGLAAYAALTDSKKNKVRKKAGKARAQVHLAATQSPRAAVRAAGCRGARDAKGEGLDALRVRLTELLDDLSVPVHEAAIEALDALFPKDQNAFATAYGSKFWTLRVRAAELQGKRRNADAVAPMAALLALPSGDINRPSDDIRRRASAAMADVADAASMAAYVTLLDDGDGHVREMGGRGLAGAVKPGLERPLVAALSHDDLPVRSWVAEGLARLGDVRAVPVLAGTLAHDHKPIRLGAILSFVALGHEGLRGVLQGLEDTDREIQDLVFSIVVARDVALARSGLAPDLLAAALAASSPELRFAAARVLEVRSEDPDALDPLLEELVGPRKPDRASALAKWPPEAERRAMLGVLISVLASDEPATRYAAARVLSLRPQPEAFWREAKRLQGPKPSGVADAPATAPESEAPQSRKRSWIRRLAATLTAGKRPEDLSRRVLEVIRYAGGPNPRTVPSSASGTEDLDQVVFGTYVGLVRQAPVAGASDETHRVRRDALARLGALAQSPHVGRAAVLPAVRRALSDPHHLVRKAASATLSSLYSEGDTTPASLALQASYADVGRGAVDSLVARALQGDDSARALALDSVNAAAKDVRSHGVQKIQQLFEAGSLEPWLVALGSRFADVRLSVVTRLVDAQDARVDEALARALESDHEDLRERAATALAKRGDVRAADVLAGFLRHDESRVVRRALDGLVTLVRAREVEETAASVARILASRLEDDPEQTADVPSVVRAIALVGHPDGEAPLLRMVRADDVGTGTQAFDALLSLARHRSEPSRTLPDGRTRRRFDDARALQYIDAAARHADPQMRALAVAASRDVDDAKAEAILARLLDDRDETVRVAAAEAVAFRAEAVKGAGLDALGAALRRGRRDLVLPAAAGMAKRQRPEALQPLLLVLGAGEQPERERALLALGHLADPRCLPDIESLLDPDAELSDEDRALAPVATEALGRMLGRFDDADTQARIRKTVETAAAEGGSQVRLRALTGLRWAGDERSRGLLEAAVADAFEDATVRRHAATLLGELGNTSSEAVLAEALSDDDRGLRSVASKALALVFPEDTTRVNMARIRSPHDDVAEPAAGFLARNGDPSSLLERLPHIESAPVRARLRRGLVRRGALPAEAIAELLGHDAPGVRADAAWLAGAAELADLAGAAAAAAKKSAAQWDALAVGTDARRRDAEAEAWRACLWAVRRGKADGALAQEVLAHDKAPPAVLAEAIRLLEAAGETAGLPVVRGLLRHHDSRVRVAAARAIAVMDPGQAGAVALSSEVTDGRVAAVLAHAALDTDAKAALSSDASRPTLLPPTLQSSRTDALRSLATEGDGTARLTAIAALGRLGGDESVSTLQGLLDSDGAGESLRKAIFRALRRAQRRTTTTQRQEHA